MYSIVLTDSHGWESWRQAVTWVFVSFSLTSGFCTCCKNHEECLAPCHSGVPAPDSLSRCHLHKAPATPWLCLKYYVTLEFKKIFFLLAFYFSKGLVSKELLQFNNKEEGNLFFLNRQKIWIWTNTLWKKRMANKYAIKFQCHLSWVKGKLKL